MKSLNEKNTNFNEKSRISKKKNTNFNQQKKNQRDNPNIYQRRMFIKD